MSEYPEDIDRIATDIVRTDFSKSGDEPEWLLYKAIASALMAERQRCAKRAWNHFTQEKDGSNATRCGAIIAEAIME